MYADARRAYEAGARTGATSRKLEAAALFSAARRLEACRPDAGADGARGRWNEALTHNQRLWTLFQLELARPDHPMPLALRVDVLRLSAFVDRRTLELLAAPSDAGLQALIDINRHLAEGLSTPA